MTKNDTNPFLKVAAGNRIRSSVRSLKATLEPRDDAWSLTLSPIRSVDVAAVWTELVSVPSTMTLVFNDPRPSVTTSTPVAVIAKCLGIEVFEVLDDQHIVIDDASLESLVSAMGPATPMAVRIDGPIEPMDAAAIDRAVVGGGSPLDAELRAVLAVRFTDDGVVVESRRRSAAIRLLAESFRHYLGALLSRSSREFSPPELWQLDRVLELSGSILVRPIETDVFAGSVDVGICTETASATGPATRSLVYDRPSDGWHDEL